ncbi:Predicted RNA-binding protein, contains Pumilio domains [Phaffia rhodozyma]|uniref:Nucleolar protein 9 n=1 Tax=Phaffia rhodozyma TaxID=264483 RepID=A0A0F7SMQ6_PHARH|nr:Predicted RNA-binding protein, contains Pumilio domains [Phaffia rhodozyma]
MPKELVRKRGKRKAKNTTDDVIPKAFEPTPAPSFVPLEQQDVEQPTEESNQISQDNAPSGRRIGNMFGGEADWVTPSDGGLGSIRERIEGDAPWGFVDPEVKSYFKTVDDKLKVFEDLGLPQGEDADEENEDRHLLLTAALSELRSRELQLATDTDCALVLERMIWNMGDFGRRVFADSLMGNYAKLIQHRFGSHVVQTLFTLGALTIDRECRNVFPSQEQTADPSEGVLPRMSSQIHDIAQELLPLLPTLIQSPFSSHPIRVLLLLLTGRPIPSAHTAGGPSSQSSAIRSKRSTKFAKSNANFKAFVQNDEETGADAPEGTLRAVPDSFNSLITEFWGAIRGKVGEVEIRALGVGQVAGPVIQMLIELEAQGGASNEKGSLMDTALSGLITTLHESSEAPSRSDYLELLLRDATGSHLFELLLRVAPDPVFSSIWSTYFVGRMGKLGVHPVANFVVAKAVTRLGEQELASLLDEVKGDWRRAVMRARTGVIKAVIDRAADLQVLGDKVLDTVCQSFEIQRPRDESFLVPCVLTLKPLKRYRKAAGIPAPEGEEADEVEEEEEEDRWKEPEPRLEAEPEMTEEEALQAKRRLGHLKKVAETADPLGPNIQGSLILQSLLRLPSQENETVISSLLAQPIDYLLKIAHSPISSRLLDVIVDSPTVPFKSSRKVILAFLGNFYGLVDDRVGSRVGEKLWAHCDGFLKTKIARTLVPFEITLSSSQYGRFFARKVNIGFFKRREDEWLAQQTAAPRPTPAATNLAASVKPIVPVVQPIAPVASTSTPVVPASSSLSADKKDKKRKRDKATRPEEMDEIDRLFAGVPEPSSSSVLGSISTSSEEIPRKKPKSAVEEKEEPVLKETVAASGDDLGDGFILLRKKEKKEKKAKKEKKEKSSKNTLA